MINIFTLFGIAGLIFIIIGIIKKKRKSEFLHLILGGIFLEIYSISIKDIVFIILQLVFIAVAIYEYSLTKKTSLSKKA